MGHLELTHVDYFLDDGRQLLRDVNLRLGEGERCALIGSNGVGKTTLLRILAGELEPHDGSRSTSGTFGYMRQLVGQVRDATTIESLLLTTSTKTIAKASADLRHRETRMLEVDDERTQMAYAQAVVDWGDAGGYDEEVRWDAATVRAIGEPFDRVAHRPASTLSGGQQKRLVLEALATGPHDVLVLDEPDNYLDVEGKAWLEALIRDTPKSILFVTHDREVIARAASSIATLERSVSGASVWLHGSGYADYAAKRVARNARIDELRRRWFEDEQQLKDLVLMYRQKAKYNSDMAKRYQAAQSRLERFRAEGAPEAPPVDEELDMRLAGGRTAKRAVVMRDVEVPGLLGPVTTEIWFGDRVAVVGRNGTGKSHFLRVIAREAADDEPLELVEARREQIPVVENRGRVSLGSRVRPGYFVQTHDRDDLAGRTLLDILSRGDGGREGLDRGRASSALNRYGLVSSAQSKWDDLSGGQRARFQVLLLELGGATLLLLDEPTDNLDVESAEALELALSRFAGTVVAVTHDRWFARSFERFLALDDDGSMAESVAPLW